MTGKRKNIYLIGSTMGVGKTTICQFLKNKLECSVFLDGDWCWDSHPFQVTDEKKKMVIENICFMLNQFIRCSAYENVIFCWVMHEQSIIDEIFAHTDFSDCTVKCISLMCSEEELRKRLQKDIMNGIRNEDVVERSIARLPMYEKLNTCKIDVSQKKPDAITNEMIAL